MVKQKGKNVLPTLEHLGTRKAAEAGVLRGITCYDELVKHIIEHALTKGDKGSDAYNKTSGEVFEVYTEFFLKRFGTEANPRLGILNVEHTSYNEFTAGLDFHFKTLPTNDGGTKRGKAGLIQSKFRSVPTHKFTLGELATFNSVADGNDIPKGGRRVLFTNLEHNTADGTLGVFHYDYKFGPKQMRVLDRLYQEEHIDRDPLFWSDLEESVSESGKAPSEFNTPPALWDHQQRMVDASIQHITEGESRGRIVCATGGGKTEVQYRVIKWAFDGGATLCVVVAPTIDLLRQHHEYFEQYGMFHQADAAVIHFRTGDEARSDDFIDYDQTTSEDQFQAALLANDQAGKKTLVFVTYKSEEKFFNILHKQDTWACVCVWDEFHHTVRQDESYRDHLLTLPVYHNLFFSASQKRGRVLSSFDEEVYGPLLADITYAELRQLGILVPNLVIKPIRLNTKHTKLSRIARDLAKVAKREGFDLRTAMIEAAACIVVREDLLETYGRSNVVTFSKRVDICKAITTSKAVRDELGAKLFETVHAAVPSKQRKDVYAEVKASDDSMLCQHSVVKEGINITPFNAAIFSRAMDIIGTQQGAGRIVRVDPIDAANLKDGKISIDSPIGWKKYTAVVYVIVHDDKMDSFSETVKDFIEKLQFAGFEEKDYSFEDVAEERTGKSEKPDGDMPIVNTKELFKKTTLKEQVKQLVIEMEEESKYADIDRHVRRSTSITEAFAGL